MEIVRFIVSLAFLAAGMFFFISAAFGVNRFHHALNRIHAAALGDTLGILFFVAGLVVQRGICFASAKLLAVVFFFWIASPVASHMIGRLVIETDSDPGELHQLDLTGSKSGPDPKAASAMSNAAVKTADAMAEPEPATAVIPDTSEKKGGQKK